MFSALSPRLCGQIETKDNSKSTSEPAEARPRRHVKKTEKAKLLEEEKFRKQSKKFEDEALKHDNVSNSNSSGKVDDAKMKTSAKASRGRSKTPLTTNGQSFGDTPTCVVTSDVVKPTTGKGRRNKTETASAVESSKEEKTKTSTRSRSRKPKEADHPAEVSSQPSSATKSVRPAAKTETPRVDTVSAKSTRSKTDRCRF
jgi:hypothetical protein